MAIIEYRIATGDARAGKDAEDILEEEVMDLIRAGWEPVGGVAAVLQPYTDGKVRPFLRQAMIRKRGEG
jgi:hypothetical protein